MRFVWTALGYSSLAAGAAGVFLPLLPATPFFLLAAYAFSRSSPRLEAWLMAHPRWGPPIRDWRREGAISRRAKATAIAVICMTPIVTWLLGASLVILAIQAAILSVVVLFIATRPAPGSSGGAAREEQAGPQSLRPMRRIRR